jgi:hypothetical protein
MFGGDNRSLRVAGDHKPNVPKKRHGWRQMACATGFGYLGNGVRDRTHHPGLSGDDCPAIPEQAALILMVWMAMQPDLCDHCCPTAIRSAVRVTSFATSLCDSVPRT